MPVPIAGCNSAVEIDGNEYSFGHWRLSTTCESEEVTDTSQVGVRTLPGDRSCRVTFEGPFNMPSGDARSLDLSAGSDFTFIIYLDGGVNDGTPYFELSARAENITIEGDMRDPVSVSVVGIVTSDASLIVV